MIVGYLSASLRGPGTSSGDMFLVIIMNLVREEGEGEIGETETERKKRCTNLTTYPSGTLL